MLNIDHVSNGPAVYQFLDLPDPGRVPENMADRQEDIVFFADSDNLPTVLLCSL